MTKEPCYVCKDDPKFRPFCSRCGATGEHVMPPPASLTSKTDLYRRALERIAKWFGEFPATGRTWDDGSPMSYAACFGSNGERDYMRQVAIDALAAAQHVPVETPARKEPPYYVRTFWSPDRKYLVTAHVYLPEGEGCNVILLQDDNAIEWEPTEQTKNITAQEMPDEPPQAYTDALNRVHDLMGADPDPRSRDGFELKILAGIVDEYEKLRWPMGRSAEEPIPPHPGPSIAKAFARSPRRIPARDAEHCDYPDCEQHWTEVVDRALAAMKALHESAEPDTDHPELPAVIPATAFREFVDEHARLMRIRASGSAEKASACPKGGEHDWRTLKEHFVNADQICHKCGDTR